MQKKILRSEKALTGRPGETMPPADFAAAKEIVAKLTESEPSDRDVISHLLYPQVHEKFAQHQKQYSDVSENSPTPTFFHGMEPQEEIAVEIDPGKTLIIKYLTLGEPHADGTRSVFFELNGQPRCDGAR